MTATGSKRPPISRKSLTGQILFVIVLLIIARILWTHNQPERLTSVRVSSDYQILGDDLYGLNAQVSAIQVQSLHESRARTLVPNDPNYPFYAQFTKSELSIVDGNLYYAVKARSTSPSHPNILPAYATFLLAPKGLPSSPVARQKRTQRTQYPPSTDEIKIRQIPLQGGTPRDVATFHSDNICLVGDHVFWVQPEAEVSEMVSHIQGWWEATAHSDLMLTSLKEGTTRCIYHGIYRYTGLRRQASGITWTVLAPYPQQATLFYAGASDGVPHSLDSLKHQSRNISALDLIELGGRLYWQADPSPALMSSNLDGTDIREVLQPSGQYVRLPRAPFSYRNALYCYIKEAGTIFDDRSSIRLCRVHPDQPDPIEMLNKLPSLNMYTHFDGHLYFERQEHQRSAWATMTGDDANETSAWILCRFAVKP